MSPYVGMALLAACVAILCPLYVNTHRKLRASRALCDAQRSALMLEMEQNAELLACSAKLLAASNALHDAVSAQTIIVPPAGGMVA
jgi:hypothetical protein